MNDFLYIFSSLLFCQNTGPKCRKYETVQPHVGRRTGKWEYRLIKELASKDSRRWRYTFRIALSTMSALRRSLRAGFAAAKRVTAVNAVGAAGPARAILAGSLRTQVRSDCFSETQSCSRRSRSIGRHARVPRSARPRGRPRGFRSRDGLGSSVLSSGIAVSRPTPVRPLPAGIAAAPRSLGPRAAAAASRIGMYCPRFSHRFFPALTRARTRKHRPCPP